MLFLKASIAPAQRNGGDNERNGAKNETMHGIFLSSSEKDRAEYSTACLFLRGTGKKGTNPRAVTRPYSRRAFGGIGFSIERDEKIPWRSPRLETGDDRDEVPSPKRVAAKTRRRGQRPFQDRPRVPVEAPRGSSGGLIVRRQAPFRAIRSADRED